jgi:glutamate 5-kinase
VQTTLLTLLERGIIPIINENDTVTVGDIRKLAFKDNDSLAAHVAVSTYADLIIILTDVEGLYTKNPKEPDAELVKIVKEITDKELEMCSGTSQVGRGGMLSKVRAAKMATEAGVKVVVCNGTLDDPVVKALNSELGTTFLPVKKMNPKKHWIAFASEPKGKIIVNEGAEKAMVEKNSSLLPIGIVGFEGEFDKGDVVEIANEKGKLIARGITNYFSREIPKIKGKKEEDVFAALGYAYHEAVPRASMVLIKGGKFAD